MKTCPNCGELNGDGRTDCFKCHAPFKANDSYKKICPKCGRVYAARTETCEKCGLRLSVYSGQTTAAGSDNEGCWLYVVSALIPLLGIILGCIYIARREDDLGKSLIITGVASNIIFIVLAVLLQSCSI